MDTFLLVIEIVGTVAFAVSGALTALRKNMDLLGVLTLGLTAAVGGGVLRDVLLGITPPTTFRNPMYALIAIGTSLVVFLPPSVHYLSSRQHAVFHFLLNVMDAVGLGLFTVSGIQKAYTAVAEPSVFLLVFVGVITGVGGGVLRDVMAGDKPYIFAKHFYASSSIIGALVCVGVQQFFTGTAGMLAGAACVTLLRILAAIFRWKLPKYQNLTWQS